MLDGGSRMLIDAVLQTWHACALMLPVNGLPARINTALLPHEHRLHRNHTTVSTPVTSCMCAAADKIVFIEKKSVIILQAGATAQGRNVPAISLLAEGLAPPRLSGVLPRHSLPLLPPP